MTPSCLDPALSANPYVIVELDSTIHARLSERNQHHDVARRIQSALAKRGWISPSTSTVSINIANGRTHRPFSP
jgi:hypothetical protein